MRINGRNRLACKTLIKDVNPDKPITVEPIKGLPVEKDLVVDMEPFFDAYREVMPFLVTNGQRADPGAASRARPTASGSTTPPSASCAPRARRRCPVFWTDGQYFGPAAIVNAHRFIFDSRDEGGDAAAGDPQRQGGRVALPHHLQLHRGLPARHRGHQGDPGGQAGDHHPPRLTGACLARACRHSRTATPLPASCSQSTASASRAAASCSAPAAAGARALSAQPAPVAADAQAADAAGVRRAATVDPRLSVGGEELASMGVVVDLPSGVPAPPALKDVSWVLADLATG